MKKLKFFTLAVAAVLAAIATSCGVDVSETVNREMLVSKSEVRSVSDSSDSGKSPKRVTGYFCEWGIYQAHGMYFPQNIPYDKLTHINYAFIGLNPETQAVEIYDKWATSEIVSDGESWDTQYTGNLGLLRKYKAKYPHVKVLISVGGWTKSHGFHAAAASEATRKRAARNLVDFVVQNNLDGIDIDWEYPGIYREKEPGDEYDMGAPGGIEDKEKFTLFLKAIRSALDDQGAKDGKYYELTAAVGAGYDKIELTNPGDYCKYLDAVNLMTYDMHGAWAHEIGHQAPLYANPNEKNSDAEIREKYNIDWAVSEFIRQGVPASKIVLGVPFYSRGWKDVTGGWDADGDGKADGMFGKGSTNKENNLNGLWGEGGQNPYYRMKEIEKESGWEKFRDPYTNACWLYNRSLKQLYTYDDAVSIQTKMNYINEKGLGGAMYWELDGDDWKNGNDLINIIADAMLDGYDFDVVTNPVNPPDNPPSDDPSEDTPPSSEIPDSSNATGVPAAPSIEQTTWNGESTFGIKMNMWWGQNGTLAELLENGTVVQSVNLKDNSPSAQSHTFTVTGKANGTYKYQVRLSNKFGSTLSNTVSYTVTKGSASSGSENPPEDESYVPQPEPDPVPDPETTPDPIPDPEPTPDPVPGSYPLWSADSVSYAKGDLVIYNGTVYQCDYAHTSNAAWVPGTAGLWFWVARPDLDGSNPSSGNPAQPENPEDPEDPEEPEPYYPEDPDYPEGPVNTELPKRIMSGYWHTWDSGTPFIKLRNVDSNWDVINISFAEPERPGSGDGKMKFSVSDKDGYSLAEFKKDIKTLHGKGKKIVLSIGGYEGYFYLENSSAVSTFVKQINALVDEYGFDGIDIDLEQSSVSLNSGADPDFKKPTTPRIKNMISAIRQICDAHGDNFILSWAPETFYMQLGHEYYGGINGYVDNRAGSYIPLIYALRDKTTYVQAQLYNSGSITGRDGKPYSMGTVDGIVEMCNMLLEGFTVNNNPSYVFPALRPDQVVIAVPCSQGAAGSGQISNKNLQEAFKKIDAKHPGLRGIMTWSINWDAYQNNNEFVQVNKAFLNKLN